MTDANTDFRALFFPGRCVFDCNMHQPMETPGQIRFIRFGAMLSL